MKRLLFALLLLIPAALSQSCEVQAAAPVAPTSIFGLSADKDFVLYEGSLQYFDGDLTLIRAYPTIDALTGDTRVDIRVTDFNDAVVGSVLVVLDRATVDAESSSETGESDIYAHCVMKAVKAYLEGITENSTVTFTLMIS